MTLELQTHTIVYLSPSFHIDYLLYQASFMASLCKHPQVKAAVINQFSFAADILVDCREILTGVFEKDFRKHKGTLAVLCALSYKYKMKVLTRR